MEWMMGEGKVEMGRGETGRGEMVRGWREGEGKI